MTRQTLAPGLKRALTRGIVLFSMGMVGIGSAEPIAHQYFTPDPEEDLKFDATVREGSLPAAMETRSGVVGAPTSPRDPYRAKTAYGGGATPDSPDSTYRIDRNTARPKVVTYDEPFAPSIAPFKRLYAFDQVSPSLELVVREAKLSKLPVSGELTEGEDAFYGDLFVDLVENTPVRIPSVGPGARLLASSVVPNLPVVFLRDGADNWFVQGSRSGRVRLLLQVAIDRRVFGSAFADVSWQALEAALLPLPSSVHQAAAEVIERIGVSRQETPSQALAKMVAYFRGFSESERAVTAKSGVELYLELSRQRQGVCRHRAYAFVITALKLGIPSRFVRNEAHAWVEVFDTSLWHRIDLGGAAEQMDFDRDPAGGVHMPPPDPYQWPEGSSSGASMLGREGPQVTGSVPEQNANDAPGASPPAETADSSQGPTPQARVTLNTSAPETVQRGGAFGVHGEVAQGSSPCGNVRVDLFLQGQRGNVYVGSTATTEQGSFKSQVVVPRSLEVGEYQIVARSRESRDCSAAVSN